MGKKSEMSLMNEIEVTASSTLIKIEEKKKLISKNVNFLKKYGYTDSWWYDYQLPIILKRVGLK